MNYSIRDDQRYVNKSLALSFVVRHYPQIALVVRILSRDIYRYTTLVAKPSINIDAFWKCDLNTLVCQTQHIHDMIRNDPVLLFNYMSSIISSELLLHLINNGEHGTVWWIINVYILFRDMYGWKHIEMNILIADRFGSTYHKLFY